MLMMLEKAQDVKATCHIASLSGSLARQVLQLQTQWEWWVGPSSVRRRTLVPCIFLASAILRGYGDGNGSL